MFQSKITILLFALLAIVSGAANNQGERRLRQAAVVPEHEKDAIVEEAAEFAAKHLKEQKEANKKRKVAGVAEKGTNDVEDLSLDDYYHFYAPPTKKPTMFPTRQPSYRPTTSKPTVSSAPSVSYNPTQPTVSPTTRNPTTPTVRPTTAKPSATPTVAPTIQPTVAPSAVPTEAPSTEPTVLPSTEPSVAPTETPSIAPTEAPSTVPTEAPTLFPSSLTCAPSYSYQLDSPTPAPTDSICGCCSRISSRNVTFVTTTVTTVTVTQYFEE